MVRNAAILLISLWSSVLQSQEVDKNKEKKKKIEPLSEQFLLFLAEMENVEGDLIHPVDLNTSDTNVLDAKTKTKVKQETKDGKAKDDN